MITRSKVVEFSGYRFRVNRLPPDAGSFIFMRMLGTSMRMNANTVSTSGASKKQTEEEQKELSNITGEMRVRALAFGVFSGSISFEDFKFIQEHCMKVVSIITERAGEDFPLPIMDGQGAYTPDGLPVAEDVSLVTKLTTEVLVLCFTDFFEESSPGL